MGYKRLPPLAQIMIVFENLNKLRWKWIFTGKVGGSR